MEVKFKSPNIKLMVFQILKFFEVWHYKILNSTMCLVDNVDSKVDITKKIDNDKLMTKGARLEIYWPRHEVTLLFTIHLVQNSILYNVGATSKFSMEAAFVDQGVITKLPNFAVPGTLDN
uniref:Uncharacterized protein n=1 Tax=Romanomermis culicivorax TaxID=13658 RepID=A0A915KIG9_ROMCU